MKPFLSLLSDLHSPWGPSPGSSNKGLSVLHDSVRSGNLSVPNTEVSLQGLDSGLCHEQECMWTTLAALPAGPNEKCHFVLQRMSLTHQ